MSDVLLFAVRLVELVAWSLMAACAFVAAMLLALVAVGCALSWLRAVSLERVRKGYLDDCSRKRWGRS